MAVVTREPDVPAPAGPPAPAPRRPRRVRAGALRRWRGLPWVLVAVVAAAGVLVGVEAASARTTYPVTADFATAPGLFPGASVEVLGVPVGTVTAVRNVGDRVMVGMAVDSAHPLPARVTASLVTPELLGEPDIDLAPGYTGGPTLASGSTIPRRRTSVPVSTAALLKALQHTLNTVDPHAVGQLVTNLAQDLAGQGHGLHQLIASAAGTIQLLANKEDDLGRLSGTLAQVTGALDGNTAQIDQLVTDYDTVSGVIAQHDGQLGDALTQLSGASAQLVQLLSPNLGSIEHDTGTVTTVGRTLDRNLGSVNQVLLSATALFAAARRAYTPAHQWLNLNLQLPLGVTGAYVAGEVRDVLAGVCRRIAAHHSAGLTATELQTLQQCGTPSSGFFNPVIDEFVTLLHDAQGGTAPSQAASPASMLQQGLSEIPGVAPQPAAAPSAGASPAGGSGTTTTTPAAPAAPSSPSGGGPAAGGSQPCLGGLLGSIVTCSGSTAPAGSSPGTGSSGSSAGSGSSSGSSSSGLGGLLSYREQLTAPAARYLPPLPASAPGGRHPARGDRGGGASRTAGKGKGKGGGAGRAARLDGARR